MHIYLVVDVCNLELFKPLMMTNIEVNVIQVLSSIEELTLSTMDELKEDLVLQRRFVLQGGIYKKFG